MNSLSQVAVISRQAAVVGTDVGDLHVVLNDDLRYLGLDPIATRVWELLELPQTVDQLVGQLITEYDVDEQTCRADVGTLIDTLAEHKLVAFA
ncbi:MAG TPA: PqqD family protein [Propionibacteriaceae bacterium]|nr:PqqD family protein [Propionibacteriaceae bacterium]